MWKAREVEARIVAMIGIVLRYRWHGWIFQWVDNCRDLLERNILVLALSLGKRTMLGHSHIICLVVPTFWRIHINLNLSMNISASVKVDHEFGTSLDKL